MTVDEEGLYRELGYYVVCFQALEEGLQMLGAFALNPDDQLAGFDHLTRLTVSEQIKHVQRAVTKYVEQHAPQMADGFLERTDTILSTCRHLTQQRNEFLHSAYLYLESFDTLHGIVRTYRGKDPASGERIIRQVPVQSATFEQASREVAEAAFKVSQLRIQLIHWC